MGEHDPWVEQTYQRLRGELLATFTPPSDTDTTALPAVEPGPVPQVTFQPAEYRYTDPTTDKAWPRITAPEPHEPPDVFPPNWGSAPTERDQAAIDAGNA